MGEKGKKTGSNRKNIGERGQRWPGEGERSTAVKRLSMREDLLGDRYIRFGKSIHMWLRLLAGKNREIFFVFQESLLAMNRKNKKNV